MHNFSILYKDAPRGLLLRYLWWNGLFPRSLHLLPEPRGIVGRVIFVCMGNVCRSPYAAQRARQSGINAISCGLSVDSNDPSPPSAIKTAAKRNIDLSAHRSQPLGGAEIAPNDLILVMEPNMLRLARRQLPLQERKISLLGVYADTRRPTPYIPDPYGLPDSVFSLVFTMIDHCIECLINTPSPIVR